MAFYCSVGTWDIFCNRAIRLPHSLQQRHHGKDIHHQPNQTHHAKQQRFPLHKPTPHKTRAYGTASTPQAPELCHRRINAMILTSPCYVKPRQDFVTKNYRSRPPTQRPPPRRVANVTREQAESRDKAGGSEYIRVRHPRPRPQGASPAPRPRKAHAKAPPRPNKAGALAYDGL